jgi:hypothetical protein
VPGVDPQYQGRAVGTGLLVLGAEVTGVLVNNFDRNWSRLPSA